MAGKDDIVEMALRLISGGSDDAAKRAFANTRLKTPRGDPMRLYHMTPENISEFRASPENRSGPAVFLSPYPDFQPAYHQSAERGPAGELTSKFKEGANVMPVYADVRNPLVLDHPRKIKEAAAKYQGGDPQFPRIISPEARAAMEAEGYDGIVFGGDNPIPYGDRPMDARLGFQEGRGEEFLVFDPKRVKSAISNTGEYDFSTPDITRADGGQVRQGYQTKGRVAKSLVDQALELVIGGGDNAAKDAIRLAGEEAPSIIGRADPAIEVLRQRATEMEAPKSQRTKPSGYQIFETSPDAYKRTTAIVPQESFMGRLPRPVAGKPLPLNERMLPILNISDEVAAQYASKMAPYQGKNVEYFYHTGPIYEKAFDLLGNEGAGRSFMDRFSKVYAGTSPRTPTEQNLLNSSLLSYKAERGLPLDRPVLNIGGNNDVGYPMISGMHPDLTRRLLAGEDIFANNPKPSSFAENVRGNLQGVTADTHNIRGILASYEELRPGTLPRQWFKTDVDYDQYIRNGLTPDILSGGINDSLASQAVNKVSRQSEYGPMADITARSAEILGEAPAPTQSLGWFGLGDMTNLKSAPKTLTELMGERIDVTAQKLGITPEAAARLYMQGKIPLLNRGGRVDDLDDDDIDDAIRIAKDVGGSTPVMMEDAKGNKYDAQGNVIPPQNPGPNPARMSDPTLERAGMMDIGEPENYETEVKPFIEAATTPMNYALESPAGYSDLPVSTGTVQTAEPTLLETMKIATQLAASGQPSDERGAANWSRGRQEAVRRLVGAPEGGATSAYRGPFTYNPSDTANYLNTLIDFSPYAFVEMAHDLPYEGARTGDYGTAAIEGALNAALTAPGIAAIGAMGRAGYNALRRNPKTAAGLAGVGAYFMPEDAEAGPERWFSKLFRAAEALPMEKMTGEQALAMLRKSAPQEEIKWTGLEGFASENPVTTKQALLDFIKRNQVQTQDVVLGGGTKPFRREDVALDDDIKSQFSNWINNAQANKAATFRDYEAKKKVYDSTGTQDDFITYRQAADVYSKASAELIKANEAALDAQIAKMGGLGQPLRYGPGTRYEQYNTLGGEDYRETLVTLPAQDIYTPYVEKLRKDAYQVAYKDAIDGGLPEDRAAKLASNMISQFQPHELARLVSKTKELNEITLKQEALDKSVYKSGHWDNPNIVGHIRTQMLTANPPGANRPMKLFNVDEAQSDWGKAGRDTGFYNPKSRADWKKKYEENETAIRDAQIALKAENARVSEILGPEPKLYGRDFDNYHSRRQELLDNDPGVLEARSRLNSFIERGRELDAQEPPKGGVAEAPYVTSTQGWTDFSIKKALDQAIDSGADYFTFTPGEVQAERYNLSNYISDLRYDPNYQSLKAYDKDGNQVISKYDVPPEKIAEYVGKETAEKLMARRAAKRQEFGKSWTITEEPHGEFAIRRDGKLGWGAYETREEAERKLEDAFEYENPEISLEGLDLKVGGEGMIDYYNNIYKKRVEKVVKDLTGKKVQWEVLPAETSEGIVPRLGFRIDDDLREAKFPTFASGGIVNKALELTRDY